MLMNSVYHFYEISLRYKLYVFYVYVGTIMCSILTFTHYSQLPEIFTAKPIMTSQQLYDIIPSNVLLITTSFFIPSLLLLISTYHTTLKHPPNIFLHTAKQSVVGTSSCYFFHPPNVFLLQPTFSRGISKKLI